MVTTIFDDMRKLVTTHKESCEVRNKGVSNKGTLSPDLDTFFETIWASKVLDFKPLCFESLDDFKGSGTIANFFTVSFDALGLTLTDSKCHGNACDINGATKLNLVATFTFTAPNEDILSFSYSAGANLISTQVDYLQDYTVTNRFKVPIDETKFILDDMVCCVLNYEGVTWKLGLRPPKSTLLTTIGILGETSSMLPLKLDKTPSNDTLYSSYIESDVHYGDYSLVPLIATVENNTYVETEQELTKLLTDLGVYCDGLTSTLDSLSKKLNGTTVDNYNIRVTCDTDTLVHENYNIISTELERTVGTLPIEGYYYTVLLGIDCIISTQLEPYPVIKTYTVFVPKESVTVQVQKLQSRLCGVH